MAKYFLTENEREQKLEMLKEQYKEIKKDENEKIIDDTKIFRNLKEMKEYYKQFSIKIINKEYIIEFFNEDEIKMLKALYGC